MFERRHRVVEARDAVAQVRERLLRQSDKRGFVVERYEDEPVGVMETVDKATWLTKITLRPLVTWGGEAPAPDVIAQLHHDAHHRCYIANSLKSEITVEAR